MDNRLLTQLEILKLSGEKPNFSKLGREYGIDRRTVKRYYDGYAGKPAARNKPSKLDQHEAIIRQKMAIRGATIKAVYEFLYGKYGESNFIQLTLHAFLSVYTLYCYNACHS